MIYNYEINVLMVEDNTGDQYLLTDLLYSAGIKINVLHTAATLGQAFQLLNRERIDIVLLDLSLPDSSGMDTFNAIQKKYSSIPVVILSGITDMRLALEAITLGAQDYLIKGDFDEKLLTKTILYSIERMHNLQAIQESSNRFNLVSKATNDMVWDWNLLTHEVVRQPEGWRKLIGDDRNEELGTEDDWFSRVHPEDLPKLEAIRQEIYADRNRTVFEVECRIRKNDNSYAYVHDRGFILRNEQGEPIRLIGAAQDITSRKRTEAELEKLSLIARETVNAVVITDVEERIQWVNEAFTRYSGYELSEIVGRKPGSFMQGPETNNVVRRYMRQKIVARESFECDLINYSKTGRKYWVRIQCQPQFDSSGNLQSFFSMQTDITREKAAEEQTRLSEEKYRNLFDFNPASIIIWDPETLSILEVNKQAVEEYGYSKAQFLTMTVLDYRQPAEHETFRKLAEQFLNNTTTHFIGQWEHYRSTGELIQMKYVSHLINFNGRKAVLALGENITAHLQLEKTLEDEREKKQQEITEAAIRAQDNERQEIGRELHDNINQILASARLYLGLIRSEAGKELPFLDETDEMINSAIQEIRNLSHTLIPPTLHTSDLAGALESIIVNNAGATGKAYSTNLHQFDEKRLSDKLKLSIYRIVQEQLNNVNKHAQATAVFVGLTQVRGHTILTIKDDGIGFDAQKQHNGVGLLNMQTRASLFNGIMRIESAPGKGCTLEVDFPF